MRLGNALGKGHFHNRTIGFKANLIHILGRRVALDVNLFIAREFKWARKGNPDVVGSNTQLISMTPVFKHTSEFGSIIGWQINQIRITSLSTSLTKSWLQVSRKNVHPLNINTTTVSTTGTQTSMGLTLTPLTQVSEG